MAWQLSHRIVIPWAEITLSASRSGGPGGQNVNKTNSKVTLHWDITANHSLSPEHLARFQERFPTRINKEGQVYLSSEEHRDRKKNEEACLEKLRSMILSVEFPPLERKKTKPKASQKRQRLKAKKVRSETKKSRGRPSW